MPRDAVSRTANVGTVGMNGLIWGEVEEGEGRYFPDAFKVTYIRIM